MALILLSMVVDEDHMSPKDLQKSAAHGTHVTSLEKPSKPNSHLTKTYQSFSRTKRLQLLLKLHHRLPQRLLHQKKTIFKMKVTMMKMMKMIMTIMESMEKKNS